MGALGHRIHGVMEGEGTKHVRFSSNIGSGRSRSRFNVWLLNLRKFDKNETLKKRESKCMEAFCGNLTSWSGGRFGRPS